MHDGGKPAGEHMERADPNRAVTTMSTRPLIVSEAGARITSATPIKPASVAGSGGRLRISGSGARGCCACRPVRPSADPEAETLDEAAEQDPVAASAASVRDMQLTTAALPDAEVLRQRAMPAQAAGTMRTVIKSPTAEPWSSSAFHHGRGRCGAGMVGRSSSRSRRDGQSLLRRLCGAAV